ncbi:MAG: hypothetical protein H5T71_00375, partial [Chloroflexi bacterium]|nr:hypothetical protein [Chloroflexota bacterium]
AFRKNLRIITYTMWQTQGTIGRNIIDKLLKEYKKEYGNDWVDLGFKPGGITNLRLMTSSLKEAAAGVDYQGKSLDEFPLTKEVKALDKPYVAFIIDFPAGTPGAADPDVGGRLHAVRALGAVQGYDPRPARGGRVREAHRQARDCGAGHGRADAGRRLRGPAHRPGQRHLLQHPGPLGEGGQVRR